MPIDLKGNPTENTEYTPETPPKDVITDGLGTRVINKYRLGFDISNISMDLSMKYRIVQSIINVYKKDGKIINKTRGRYQVPKK